MLKKMTVTIALAGALSLTAIPFASAQGTGTEPPKAPTPSASMSKGGGGSMMKKSSMKKSGGMMKKKHMKKKM